VPGLDFKDFTAEALFVDPASSGGSGAPLGLTVLSDDGGLKVEGMECKDLPKRSSGRASRRSRSVEHLAREPRKADERSTPM
jgi:hypothetical protein